MNKKWFNIIALVLFSVFIPILIAFCIMQLQRCYGETLNVNDTILLFVGILATFIVVGNYLQVKSIEEKVDNYKKELEKQQNQNLRKTKKIEKKIYDLQIDIYRLCGSLYSDMLMLKDNKFSNTIKYYKACDLLLEYYSKGEKDQATFNTLDFLADYNIQFDNTISTDNLKYIKKKFEENGFNPVSLNKYLQEEKNDTNS